MKTFIDKIIDKGLVLGISSLIFVGCSDNFTAPSAPTGTTIADVAADTDSLKAFSAALNKVGLYANFDNVNGGQFTILAPSNYSFVKYLRSLGVSIGPVTVASAGDSATKKINALTATSSPSISTLVTRLNYHIISSSVPSSAITAGQGFTTMNGARLSLSHVSSATYPYQVNADVAGNGANIIDPDHDAANGVVHVIDRVMAPIATTSVLSFIGMGINYNTTPGTITLPGANNYNIFANALKVTGVAYTLLPNATLLPDYTVFVPDDASFVAFLMAATPSTGVTDEASAITFINSLSATDNGTAVPTLAYLTKMANYHVVAGRFLSTDFSGVMTTLSTGTFTIDATMHIADAHSSSTPINTANILTNAGVAHVIGGVLVP